jgi:hypothetical protein
VSAVAHPRSDIALASSAGCAPSASSTPPQVATRVGPTMRPVRAGHANEIASASGRNSSRTLRARGSVAEGSAAVAASPSSHPAVASSDGLPDCATHPRDPPTKLHVDELEHWRRSAVTARVTAQPNARRTARSNIDGVNVVPRDSEFRGCRLILELQEQWQVVHTSSTQVYHLGH